MAETPNINQVDGTYKPSAFQKVCNTFFNYAASAGRPVAAGDCLLTTFLVAKRNLRPCLLKPFSPASRKHCVLLIFCTIEMKKNLTRMKPRSCSSTPFLTFTSGTIFNIVTMILKLEHWKIWRIFQGHYNADQSNKSTCYDDQSHASCCKKPTFAPCDKPKSNTFFQ